MDKSTEKETHDFMNVESFSQLPFIRPHAPVKEKGIRLFGIEFGSGGDTGTTTEHSADSAERNYINEEETTVLIKENETNVDTNRRFECHYCCRNFPTSQALGGHQNAHKRERQHAKRAHLQSAMVHDSLADAHIYGLMNYTWLTGSAAPAPAPPNITFPSWNSSTASTNTNTDRFYGSHSTYSHQAAINGSPLGLWRIPGAAALQTHASFNRDRSMQHPLPLFASDQELKSSHMQVGVGSSSQSRFVYESKQSSQDHVSLDLHL